MDSLLASASAVLGRRLTDPVQLSGSSRTTVLRARTEDGDAVVVKAYNDTPDAAGGFTAEAAALAFTESEPRLLAVDRDVPLIVMSDLGSAPSLADALLGQDPSTARSALLEWAAGYGRLAVATAGRRDEWTELRKHYDLGQPLLQEQDWITGLGTKLPGLLAGFDLAPPTGVDADLAELTALQGTELFPVFSPGDICPDNNQLHADGLRILDFESAGYYSAFLDAAYARMPFATCWCAFRLPAEIREQVEERYRAEVTGVHPELADDLVWRPGIRLATAVWTLFMTINVAPRVLTDDRPIHARRRPVASMRQVLRYRWRELLDTLEPAAHLPAVAQTMRLLLDATEHWQAEPLPLYPAFDR